jgi:hypothetical protein
MWEKKKALSIGMLLFPLSTSSTTISSVPRKQMLECKILKKNDTWLCTILNILFIFHKFFINVEKIDLGE